MKTKKVYRSLQRTNAKFEARAPRSDGRSEKERIKTKGRGRDRAGVTDLKGRRDGAVYRDAVHFKEEYILL